ncbi:LOW QUALITY PROTEIN: LUCI-like protein [Mya arenaria]|uniref:LUCI-like protein n=1 Tax=Mya arenaria TaxID=6604 RepID=A0ABY7DCB3_MYAAR|nr:LOW QUALITY PROTEIN: LUCI-like protein [Mya arenaria]
MSEKPPLRLEDIPVDATTEKTTTYSELVTRIERAASGLQAIGVMKDDDIGVLSPNHPDYLVTFYACALVLLYGEAGGDYETFESLLDPGHVPYRTPELDPRTSVAALMSSSGTTGFPKAPTNLQLVPPIMVLLAKSPKVSEYDLSSVSQIACGAAPLSKEIEDLVKEKLKLPCIFQGYGMTEVGVTHLNGRGEFRYKSVGKLLPLTEMKIVDVETGKPVGPGQEGEIWIRGPQVCGGYLGLPEQTRELFTNDGWVKTGDIGYEDEDGYLFVVDRLKELIKYKAFQVAPAILEDILLRHDAIADRVGMPDVEAGELPRAYVVRKQGREASEEEIRKFVDDEDMPTNDSAERLMVANRPIMTDQHMTANGLSTSNSSLITHQPMTEEQLMTQSYRC